MRKTLIAIALMLATPALAGMPPPEYDHNCGKMYEVVVPYGQAWAKCESLSTQYGLGHMDKAHMMIDGRALYGCQLTGTNIIVYSYDTPALAKAQGREYDSKMRSNTRRHERGHFCGWPANHPDAR